MKAFATDQKIDEPIKFHNDIVIAGDIQNEKVFVLEPNIKRLRQFVFNNNQLYLDYTGNSEVKFQ